MAGAPGGDAPAGDWRAAVKCEQPIGWWRRAARSDWLAGNTPSSHWLAAAAGAGALRSCSDAPLPPLPLSRQGRARHGPRLDRPPLPPAAVPLRGGRRGVSAPGRAHGPGGSASAPGLPPTEGRGRGADGTPLPSPHRFPLSCFPSPLSLPVSLPSPISFPLSPFPSLLPHLLSPPTAGEISTRSWGCPAVPPSRTSRRPIANWRCSSIPTGTPMTPGRRRSSRTWALPTR